MNKKMHSGALRPFIKLMQNLCLIENMDNYLRAKKQLNEREA
jgi:hypothetical protein